MHIVIKDGLCQGHGQCVDAAPDVFCVSDNDDLVHLLIDDPDDSLRPAVEDAVRRCPVEALSIADGPGSTE
jgi:ferredoxin